jgi:hypothetical protein
MGQGISDAAAKLARGRTKEGGIVDGEDAIWADQTDGRFQAICGIRQPTSIQSPVLDKLVRLRSASTILSGYT